MVKSDDDIIVFQQFDNVIDANIAKTKLDAYGIPCFLTEENMANLYPGQSLLAFKIRLHLFGRDQEKAEQILLQQNFSVENENTVRCPQCQSSRITRDFPKHLRDNLTYILFGVFFPKRKINLCQQCGNEF
jgi:hypothetical protein